MPVKTVENTYIKSFIIYIFKKNKCKDQDNKVLQ